MMGAIERDPHVRAWRARTSLLCRSRGRAATTGCAARNASRRAPHEAYQPTLEREHAAAAQRDHQAAVFDESLNLRQALIADTPGDVVGFSRRPETGSLHRFLEWHRRPGSGQPLDLLSEFEIDMSIKKNIDFRMEISRANVFVAQIGVRHLALVEGIANPSDRICVSPRNPYT